MTTSVTSEQALAALKVYCNEAGLVLSDEMLEGCLKHLDLVLEKNQVLNLTRIVAYPDTLVLHILDSLLLLPYLQEAPEGSVLDMGTGAGYPGIPLALCSGRPMTLLDSVGKKVAAVSEFCEALGLADVSCVHARLEEYAKQQRYCFAAVVARAVAPLAVLLEYARPFLVNHGRLIVTKGIPTQDELDAGINAASVLGYRFVTQDTVELPDAFGTRSLLVFEVSRPASVKLPRANGMAKKHPLG